jgi:drug/metabolite transporter (DMT)-like permease
MKSSTPSISFSGFLITLAGAIMFSTKAILVKKAFHQTSVDALSLLALRMIFSLPFYLAAAWWSQRRQQVALTRKQWLYIGGLGIFGYYLSSLFDFMGLKYVSAGLERLILFLYPTFAVFINLFLFKQPITRVQRRALALTYAGILLAFISELRMESRSSDVLWGSLLIFLCAVTYSFYIVGTGRLVQQVDVTLFTAYAMLAATGGILLHFLLRGNFTVFSMDHSLWWYGILLAVIATVIPSFMLSEGMKRLGSNNVAIILAVGPVSTILQAWLILDEKITLLQVMGTALVIIGVVLIGWKRRPLPE